MKRFHDFLKQGRSNRRPHLGRTTTTTAALASPTAPGVDGHMAVVVQRVATTTALRTTKGMLRPLPCLGSAWYVLLTNAVVLLLVFLWVRLACIRNRRKTALL